LALTTHSQNRLSSAIAGTADLSGWSVVRYAQAPTPIKPDGSLDVPTFATVMEIPKRPENALRDEDKGEAEIARPNGNWSHGDTGNATDFPESGAVTLRPVKGGPEKRNPACRVSFSVDADSGFPSCLDRARRLIHSILIGSCLFPTLRSPTATLVGRASASKGGLDQRQRELTPQFNPRFGPKL
jgi:hypothetical protein